MVIKIEIHDFMDIFNNCDESIIIFDARSPSEYKYGHIPSAINLPLFSDDERKDIGTIYSKIGREEAILKGLKYVGSKLADFITTVNKYADISKNIYLYCARGGMRSESLSWLLGLYGYNVYVIVGGYKYFRKYVLSSFENIYDVVLLGGKTGSSKTLILQDLKKSGSNIIDLEGLANHKGSAFGSLGEKEQPSQEHFENLLCVEFNKIKENKTIWLEDESYLIGRCVIPKPLWAQMQNSRLVVYLDIPVNSRARYLESVYGQYDKDLLIKSVEKIQKRLGGLNVKNAINFIENDNCYEAAIILLSYYDKSYTSACLNRECEIIRLSFDKYSEDISEKIKNISK